MVGKISLDLFNIETLKFLMLFREPGSSLYFIFISYILIFFSFLIFSLYSFFLFLFLSHQIFLFICSPLNSKIALYLPPPPCLDVARPRAKW
jgi:hypothetical protein